MKIWQIFALLISELYRLAVLWKGSEKRQMVNGITDRTSSHNEGKMKRFGYNNHRSKQH
jgi:hypothetical protein